VVPDSETKSISAEETFAVDLHTLDEVTAILRRQADRVGGRLRRAGLAGRTVTVKIRYGDFTTMTRSETLPAPTDGGSRIFEVAKGLAHQALEQGRGVRLLGVGVSSLVTGGEPVQLSVDDDTRHHRIDVAVDALRGRFGPGVVGPGPPRPVLRVREVALTNPQPPTQVRSFNVY
jgi:DNA polymerase IV